MTPEEERQLLEERDLLRKEVESLTEQVKLVVRAEHGLTRSRRLLDRQLHRIRRLGEFALGIAGAEDVPEILDQARRVLFDFFEFDEAVVVPFETDAPAPTALGAGPGVTETGTPELDALLGLLAQHGAGPRAAATPRVLVWVPLRSRTNELLALLVAWSSRANAHHRDVPRGSEHLAFLELFGSHVTRALDNAALTAELRQKNQQLSTSLADLERTQAQLVQAQKLEALGRLAGGIAHDFNNLLTVIVGASDALRPAIDNTPEAREDLETIVGATKRATAITRRLLAFGRQQESKQQSVDLNALTIDLSQMLRRLLGDGVTLQLDLDTSIPPVCADPVHLEQIIMNLVLNGRDAMTAGGTLTLETRELRRSVHPGAPSSPNLVTLRVIDTGTGIEESVRKQLFEPFFTTKPIGKGTGLGLATVYGLVKQNQGHIHVESTPGHGAAFTVSLRVAQPASSVEPSPSWASPRGTILIVEDEDGIRRLIGRLLRRAGFEVHEARDGLDAIDVESRLQRLDLVITDVVMPALGGPELVRRLRATRPALPVVYMSGYTFDSLDQGELDPTIDCFMAKPFAPDALKATVEKMLRAAAPAEREIA